MKNLYPLKTILLFLIVFNYKPALGQCLETSFDPVLETRSSIQSIVVEPNGNIITGGSIHKADGVPVSHLVRLNSKGNLDKTFGEGSPLNFNSTIRVIKRQADGKLLVAGSFTKFNDIVANRIVRLNNDGTLDNTFNYTGTNGTIFTLLIQPDGKIIIGGSFTRVNNSPNNSIARLLPNGDLDETFSTGTGANNAVGLAALQADGKLLLTGNFTSFNGQTYNRLVRLTSTGQVDATFQIGQGMASASKTLTVLSNGQIIVTGYSYNGTNLREGMARLNTDGSHDLTFPAAYLGLNAPVSALSELADGSLLVGGTMFTALTKLNADGTKHETFQVEDYKNAPTTTLVTVLAIAIDAQGKILVGGELQRIYNHYTSGIARLEADGSLDNSFTPDLRNKGTISSVVSQPDGKILLEGNFTYINNKQVNTFARLLPSGLLDESFANGGQDFHQFTGIALQSNGKIITNSNVVMNGNKQIGFKRLNSDGTPDVDFSVRMHSSVTSIASQTDDKILIGGTISEDGSPATMRNYLGRLNADGTMDYSFNTGTGPNSFVLALALQPDRKILIGGYKSNLTNYNGTPIKAMARINEDGTLDNSFNVGTGPTYLGGSDIASVTSIIYLPAGNLLVNGLFDAFNGIPCDGMVLLNEDGSVNSPRNVHCAIMPNLVSKGVVRDITLLPDNKFILAGDLQLMDGTPKTIVKIATPTLLANKEEVKTIQKRTAFPNPFQNEISFTVEKNNTGPAEIKVYNLTGALVFSKASHQVSGDVLTLSLEGLVPGAYMVELNFNNRIQRHRILKR